MILLRPTQSSDTCTIYSQLKFHKLCLISNQQPSYYSKSDLPNSYDEQTDVPAPGELTDEPFIGKPGDGNESLVWKLGDTDEPFVGKPSDGDEKPGDGDESHVGKPGDVDQPLVGKPGNNDDPLVQK